MFGFFIGTALGAGLSEMMGADKRKKEIESLQRENYREKQRLSYILTRRDDRGNMTREFILSDVGEKIVHEASVELLPILMCNGYGWNTMKSDDLWYDKKKVHRVILNGNNNTEWNSTDIYNVPNDYMGPIGDLIFINVSYHDDYLMTLAYFHPDDNDVYQYVGQTKEDLFIKNEYILSL